MGEKTNKKAHKTTKRKKNENVKCKNKSKFKILINYNEYINNTNITATKHFFIWNNQK